MNNDYTNNKRKKKSDSQKKIESHEFKKKYPYSDEAERYILGCLLLDPTLVDQVLTEINYNDFYATANRNIMIAIEALVKNGEEVDQLTIMEELDRLNVLEATGGIDYLYSLLEGVPSVANVDVYLKLLQDKTLERKLLEVVDKIEEDILKGEININDLIASSEKQIMDVINGQKVEDFKRIDLLTESVIDIIEENKKREGNLVGLDTGYPDLNKLTSGFKKNELIILAARPSIGKSTLALNLAANICRNKKHVAFFSLEMGYDQLIMRLLSTYSGLSLGKIVSGDLTDEEMRLLMQAKTSINKFPLYIDQSFTTNLRDIKSKCLKLKKEGHLDFIVIDYLQLLRSGENLKNRVDEVGAISRGLKEMAQMFEVPILALSQLSRHIEQREDKRPVMADLRESGSIEQDADIVMFLHRETPKKEEGVDTTKVVKSAKTELIVAKNRQGVTDSVNLIFKGAQSVFVSEGSMEKKKQGEK